MKAFEVMKSREFGTSSNAHLTIDFLNVPFSTARAQDVFKTIAGWPHDAPFAYVVTPNVDHVVRVHHDPSGLLISYYRNALLSTCDSRIIQLLASLKRQDIPLVTGSDLTASLFRDGLKPGESVTIVGCEDATISRLREIYPRLQIHHYNPPMGFSTDAAESEKVLQFIERSSTRLTFLAVGSPQQEHIAHQASLGRLQHGLCLCVGASINFIVNPNLRAPAWAQFMHMEWLYRLAREPRRLWWRYLVDDMAIFRIFLRSML
jgi:exopolysaccharide biosynthesis WecB/TagA/CpsF family protein